MTPEELGSARADAARALEGLDDEPPLDLAQHVVELTAVLGQAHEGRRRLRARRR